MATPATQPTETKIDPQQKAAILMAVAQLDMFVKAFNDIPGVTERMKKAAQEFHDSLQEFVDAR